MSSIKHFTELEAWKEARVLVQLSYKFLINSPEIKVHASLIDQFQRAALSSMNNIAEGFGRASNKDFAHFVNIAAASLDEVESMTYVLEDMNAISQKELLRLRRQTVVAKKLSVGLRRHLLKNQKPNS